MENNTHMTSRNLSKAGDWFSILGTQMWSLCNLLCMYVWMCVFRHATDAVQWGYEEETSLKWKVKVIRLFIFKIYSPPYSFLKHRSGWHFCYRRVQKREKELRSSLPICFTSPFCYSEMQSDSCFSNILGHTPEKCCSVCWHGLFDTRPFRSDHTAEVTTKF